MRILFLNPSGQLGGAEICLIDLLTSLRVAEPDWQLHLVTGENGPLIERARDLGVQAVAVPFPKALARLGDSGQPLLAALWDALRSAMVIFGYAVRLRRTCASLRPDVIHSNGCKMHLLALWSRIANTPVIWHIHDYFGSRSLMRHLLRLHVDRCAAAVGVSQSVLRDAQRACRRYNDTFCVYNGIDLARYTPVGPRADLDSLSGLPAAPEETIRIGLIATMAHWKGHQVFLRALAKLPEDLQYRAYVIGGAIYQTDNSQFTLEALIKFASEMGLADRVGFTGFLADTAAAMRALDIVVHASTEPEPFGRVVAEALACGRALIYSAAGGTTELVTEGQDALGHAPGDAAALAAQILKLAQNPQLRESLGRSGRRTAERRFDRARLAHELVPLYRRLSAQPGQKWSEEFASSL